MTGCASAPCIAYTNYTAYSSLCGRGKGSYWEVKESEERGRYKEGEKAGGGN